MSQYLLAIDQGTSSSRAIVFNEKSELLALHQVALQIQYPHDGWVEQDPMALWNATREACETVLASNLLPKDFSVAGLGISNQRETSIIWDRKTGISIYPAIVWQDRRTQDICEKLSRLSIAETLSQKTGLILDPYFSATKILWILDNVPGARERAEAGELAFGTVDTYLLWQLTAGKVHASDASNASRTLLYNIHEQTWDEDILEAFHIPKALLPEVKDSAADFGKTAKGLFRDEIQIAAILGDQQAALVGQACFQKGMMKCTYGTGAFLVFNTGNEVISSKNHLLSTIAYRLNGKTTYALEGSIFSAGISIQWLRDHLKCIQKTEESESLAKSIPDTGGVYLIPAFSGLGAPFWKPDARAAFLGMTGNTQIAHLVRAALEAVCYQTKDLISSMEADSQSKLSIVRVDGGMTANSWLLQFLANVLNLTIERPLVLESSALGVALFAGLQTGIYQSLADIARHWQADKHFEAEILDPAFYLGWQKALNKILS